MNYGGTTDELWAAFFRPKDAPVTLTNTYLNPIVGNETDGSEDFTRSASCGTIGAGWPQFTRTGDTNRTNYPTAGAFTRQADAAGGGRPELRGSNL